MNKPILLLALALTAGVTVLSKKAYERTLTGSYNCMLRQHKVGYKTAPQNITRPSPKGY